MFSNIFKSISNISKSLSEIENKYTDDKGSIYQTLYEYICKQNDIEIARTRALEAKANSFFPIGSLIATAYTSIFLMHLKSQFNIDLLAQYGMLTVGAYFFLRAAWFWWQAINVKGFTTPNTTTIKKTILDKCDTQEKTYNHLYNTIESVVNQRKSVNTDFGLIVKALSKNITTSVALLILATASTPISWYLNTHQTESFNHTNKYEVHVMLNYSEPEDLPLDSEDIMLEGIDTPPMPPRTQDKEQEKE